MGEGKCDEWKEEWKDGCSDVMKDGKESIIYASTVGGISRTFQLYRELNLTILR